MSNAINQLDLTDSHRTLHPTIECTLSLYRNIHSSAHGILSKLYHLLGSKTHLNKFKGTEIIPVSDLLSTEKKNDRIEMGRHALFQEDCGSLGNMTGKPRI